MEHECAYSFDSLAITITIISIIKKLTRRACSAFRQNDFSFKMRHCSHVRTHIEWKKRDCFLPKCLHMLFSHFVDLASRLTTKCVVLFCNAIGIDVGFYCYRCWYFCIEFNTWIYWAHCERPLSTSCVCVCVSVRNVVKGHMVLHMSVYEIYLHLLPNNAFKAIFVISM